MDAIGLLTADHNRVRGLITRFKSANERGDDNSMRALAPMLIRELMVHTQIEEEAFYPRTRGISDDVASTIDEGLQEHHVVKVLINEVKDVSPASDEWVAKLTVIIENVEHHADEEERDLFPPVRKAMSGADLETLGKELETIKAGLGAPTLQDKLDLTVEELHTMATEQEIPGRSPMDKEELAATVALPVS